MPPRQQCCLVMGRGMPKTAGARSWRQAKQQAQLLGGRTGPALQLVLFGINQYGVDLT